MFCYTTLQCGGVALCGVGHEPCVAWRGRGRGHGVAWRGVAWHGMGSRGVRLRDGVVRLRTVHQHDALLRQTQAVQPSAHAFRHPLGAPGGKISPTILLGATPASVSDGLERGA